MSVKELPPALTPEGSLREKCGIVGLYLPSADRASQVSIAVKAEIGLWHRGQQGAGITIKDASGLNSHYGTGGPEQVFPPDTVAYLSDGENPTWIMGQTRYGTNGNWDRINLQPITSYTPNDKKPITIAHNGQFTAIEEMKGKVDEDIPDGASDTYIFSRMLAKTPGSSWDDKIISALEKTSGAYSLVIGVENSLYLARDPQGIRPLMLGKIGDGFIAVSETHALDKIGATLIRQIKRGEVVKIDNEGIRTIKEGLDGEGYFCDFERAYFSRPDSSYPKTSLDLRNPEEWQTVYEFRRECGKILAQEYPIPNATFVIGIPDSGVPVSLGYANALRIPYEQIILRDHYDPNGRGRMFQTDYDRDGIGQRVRGKLSLVLGSGILKNAIVVLGEDSIVRGDTSKAVTEMLLRAGVREIHWIIGFPKVMHPCHLGVSMRTYEELITNRNHNDEAIARELGATSVHYISPKGFINARMESGNIYLPKDSREIFLANGGCGGCVTGLHPINKEGTIYERK